MPLSLSFPPIYRLCPVQYFHNISVFICGATYFNDIVKIFLWFANGRCVAIRPSFLQSISLLRRTWAIYTDACYDIIHSASVLSIEYVFRLHVSLSLELEWMRKWIFIQSICLYLKISDCAHAAHAKRNKRRLWITFCRSFYYYWLARCRDACENVIRANVHTANDMQEKHSSNLEATANTKSTNRLIERESFRMCFAIDTMCIDGLWSPWSPLSKHACFVHFRVRYENSSNGTMEWIWNKWKLCMHGR